MNVHLADHIKIGYVFLKNHHDVRLVKRNYFFNVQKIFSYVSKKNAVGFFHNFLLAEVFIVLLSSQSSHDYLCFEPVVDYAFQDIKVFHFELKKNLCRGNR